MVLSPLCERNLAWQITFAMPDRPHTARFMTETAESFHCRENIWRPVRGYFPQTPGKMRNHDGLEWMVVCLRLFYARHHPSVCCSLVRHRADIGKRDQIYFLRRNR